jgi:macrodomain Ter protein organizer (MatP/YcbG family)
MTKPKFKRRSISLDDTSHHRCKLLAEERATTISGLLRFLIRDAFDQQVSKQWDTIRSSVKR